MPVSVVTGGAGFLGSHLCERLLGEGHRVFCLDNLDTGSLTNIAHLRDDAFTFVNHDVTEHIAIDEPVDYVFHFASPASPIDYLRLPLQTLKVGSYGTHNALGLAKAKRARFLLASTSEVYGDPLIHPQPESYWGNVNPIGPRGVYDLIGGILALAFSTEHEPVNIGNPEEFTLLELARIVLELTGSGSEIVFEALPVNDPQQRRPDIARAREVLGWEPTVQLRDGLERMLERSSRAELTGRVVGA